MELKAGKYVISLTLCLALLGLGMADIGVATEQFPDLIFFKGRFRDLDAKSSPLQFYFLNRRYPFRATSSADYRGYYATWEVVGNQLYLKQVSYYDWDTDCLRPISFKALFGPRTYASRIPASWYTGKLRILADNNPFKTDALLLVKAGKIVDECSYTDKDSQATCSRIENSIEGFGGGVNHSLVDPEYTVLNPYTDTADEALTKIQNLSGYRAALALFSIKEAEMDYTRCRPQAVHVTLKPSNNPRTQVTWINPLDRGRPTYSWNDLIRRNGDLHSLLTKELQMNVSRVTYVGDKLTSLELDPPSSEVFDNVKWEFNYADNREVEQFVHDYQQAAAIVARHSWLLDWRKDHPSYTIGLYQDIDEEGRKAWQHAGMKGEPMATVILNDLDYGLVAMILGYHDSRLLISDQTIRDVPENHILARIGQFPPFDPYLEQNGKYVLIEPSGKWHVRYYTWWGPYHEVWTKVRSLFRSLFQTKEK